MCGPEMSREEFRTRSGARQWAPKSRVSTGGICLDVGDLMFTYESDTIPAKILWVVNEFVWIIVVDIHET